MIPPGRRTPFHFLAFLSYAALSVLWFPRLPAVWSTAIPGGLQDTRLFWWNAWWFRHAIDVLHTNPYHTGLLFHPLGSSLISHDYPLWMNLVTYVAQHVGGNLVAALNGWFMLSWVLAGFFSYLLAWEVTREPGPAWVAGVYVMTHSYTLARAMQNWGQFNLWGIALFLWLLVRARRRGGSAEYAAAGAALAWTAACHLYFLIYSGSIWIASVLADHLPWRLGWERCNGMTRVQMAFMLVGALGGGAAVWILFFSSGQLVIGSTVISTQTPANALLVMWVSLFGAWAGRYRWSLQPRETTTKPWKVDAVLAASALVCLTPLLVGAARLALQGGYPKQSILWKTHLTGANLVALVTPNPIHALWGARVSQWFFHYGMHPHEQAAMIGWVCLAVVLLARPRGRWLALAASATVLSMGTYLHLFQWNTWMPLPFYVWRLLPVLGNVRVPERWMSVGAIAWGVVLALALVAVSKKMRWPIRPLCLAAGLLVMLENWPGIPLGSPPPDNPVYETLRALPKGGVLPLPLYIGDSSVGAGDAPSGLIWEQLGTQVYHQQPMLGGYIGRVSRDIIRYYENDPYLGTLIALEEREPNGKTGLDREAACESMKKFDVFYVLLTPHALNPDAFNFVTQTLPVRPIQQNSTVELYRVNCPK